MTKSINAASIGRQIGRRGRHLGTLLLPLEPRLMFDGAAVADAAHAAADASAKALIPAVAAPVVVREADPSKGGGKKEVAFVDTSVADYRAIEAGIRDGIAIVEIGGGADGLAQMAAWAEANTGYDAIHVFSHGSEGSLTLGSNTLNASDVAQAVTQAELAEIGHALKAGGDLLLYGCDAAKGEDGQAFVAAVAAATGADVAASDDATGSADRGGDWTLETRTGSIDVESLAADDFSGLMVNPGTVDFTSDGYQTATSASGASSTASITAHGLTFTVTGDAATISLEAVSGYSGTFTNVSGVSLTGEGIEADSSGLDTAVHATSLEVSYTSAFKILKMAIGAQLTPGSTLASTIDIKAYKGSTLVVSITGLNLNSATFSGADSLGGIVTYSQQVSTTVGCGGVLVFSDNWDKVDKVVFSTNTADAAKNLTLVVDDLQFTDATVGPTITAVTASYTDTAANDSFSNTTGTISATANIGSVTGYGISGSSTGSYLSGAYDRMKAGTYGTLYVNSSTGAYTYVPDASAINAATSTVSDTFTIQASDNGGVDTAGKTMTVTIIGANDTPANSAASVTALEDTTYTFSASDFSDGFTDRDTGASFSGIKVTSAGATTGTLYYNGAAVSAAGQVVSLADFTAGKLTYVGATDGAGSGYATFSFQVYDGTAYSGSDATLTVNVTGVNDAPTRSGSIPTFSAVGEDSANTTAVSLGLSSVTAYGTGGGSDESSQTLTYTITAIPSFITLWKADGVTQVTASSTVTFAELQGLKYKTVADASGTGNLTWTVVDTGGTANGGQNTLSESMALTINAVNDAPTVSGLAVNGGSAFAENTLNGAAQYFFTGGSFADVDNSDFNGGNLTVSWSSGGTTSDILTVVTTAGENISVSGGTVSYNGNAIGTISGGTGGTALVITFTSANATPTAVGHLLKAIQYQNTSDAPAASRTVSVTLTDGASGAANTAATATVSITAENDVPALDLDVSNGGSTGYTSIFSAGGAAVTVVNSDAALSDADNANLSSLTATLAARPDGDANESLSLTSAAQTAATNAGLTVTYTAAGGVLSITGSASVSVYQTVLRGITYNNAAVSTVTDRSVTIVANDGTGNSNSTTATVQVKVAPVIDLNSGTTGNNHSASFTEDGGTVALTSTSTITDADDANLTQMVVTLTNPQDGTSEVLSSTYITNGTPQTVNGETLTFTLSNSDHTMTITGTASKATYQMAVDSLRYNNTSQGPNTTARTVTFVGTDAHGDAGASATTTVSVTAVNDAPALSGNGTLTAVNEDTTAPAGATITSLLGAGYSDPDNGSETINGVAVIGNTANASTQGAWQYSTDGGTTWYAVGTVSDGATALALSAATKLRFVPVADYNGTPPALSVRALDASYSAGWTSGAAKVTVNTTTTGGTAAIAATARDVTTSITAVNDSPTVTLTSTSVAFDKANAYVAVDSTVVLTDVDSSNLTQAVITITNPQDGSSEALSSSIYLTNGTPQTVNGETLTFTLSNSNHTLTITGTASKATYQLALRSIRFNDSAGSPNNTARSVTIQVRDDSGSGGTQDSTTATRSVTFNTAPVATAGVGEMPAVTTGSVYGFDLPAGTFTDADVGDTKSFTVSGLPAGLSIDAATGRISGTPTAEFNGTVTITCTDGSGVTATKSFTLKVSAAAHSSPTVVTPTVTPTVITVTPPNSDAGTSGLQTIVRTGANIDGGVITGTAGRGFGLSDSGSGIGGGSGGGIGTLNSPTTSPGTGGFQVALTSRSPGGGDALVVNTRVPDASFDVGSRISVTIPGDAFAHTRADATVTLVATRGDGAALPGWMTFNPRTGTFEGTPPPNFRGEVVVKVVARDSDGRQVVQTFKIAVGAGAGNVAPGGEGRGQGAPGRSGDLGHEGKLAQAVGRPSLTEQLRNLSRDGQKADGKALIALLQGKGRAA